MKVVNKREIEINGICILFEYPIKILVEYEDFFVVLMREEKEVPNNIIAYNYLGDEIWKINDIIRAKISRGFYDMEKVSEHILRVYYELGIIYEIDLIKMSMQRTDLQGSGWIRSLTTGKSLEKRQYPSAV